MSSWKKRNRILKRQNESEIARLSRNHLLIATMRLDSLRRRAVDPSAFSTLDDLLEEDGILDECTSAVKERLGLS